jgi:hypothetical protein
MPLARASLRPPAALVLVFVGAATLLSPAATTPARAQATIPAVNPAAAPPPGPSHRTAHLALGVGAGLTIASFVLAESADGAYERYLGETDPDRIEEAYDEAAGYDRLATATLIVGQACLIYGLWRRFLHDPQAKVATLPGAPRATTWSVGPRLGPAGPAFAVDVRF